MSDQSPAAVSAAPTDYSLFLIVEDSIEETLGVQCYRCRAYHPAETLADAMRWADSHAC